MSAKTAESLETPQEDIWLPQWREGIFSIFKRSVTVESEGMLPAVLCLADHPHLSDSAFPNSGSDGLFLRHCLLKGLTAINKVISFSASSCLQSLAVLTQQDPLVRDMKAGYDYYLSPCLAGCSSTVFHSGPWSRHHPSFLPTTPSFTIQLPSISPSPLPHFLSPKNLQGSINTKMPSNWFIRQTLAQAVNRAQRSHQSMMGAPNIKANVTKLGPHLGRLYSDLCESMVTVIKVCQHTHES